MTGRQYLLRSINVLNLLLLGAAAVLFFHAVLPLWNAPVSVRTPLSKEAPATSPGETTPAARWEKKPAGTDYALIGSRNLFHPDRIIPPEKKAEAEAKRPELVLHGTMIAGGLKIAFLVDKKAQPASAGRGTQIALRQGERIGGYQLREIQDKMVVLTNGDEQMILYLDELKERKGGAAGAPPGIGAPSSPAPARLRTGPLRAGEAAQLRAEPPAKNEGPQAPLLGPPPVPPAPQ